MLAAAGSDKRVKIELNETNAKGYDDDALDLLKAFAVDKGPDIFVLAHEWTGAFAEAGYALNLEDHIAKNPELYGDIIVPLWQAVSYKGARYGVPQDSEVRMYFLNNDKLRKLGKTDKEIAALPAKVDAGEFTAYDLCDLAGQAVQKGVVKYGILHRPNAGPDFQMLMEGFGLVPYDKAGGEAAGVEGRAARISTPGSSTASTRRHCPPTNTSMSWDAIEQASFARRRGARVLPRRMARNRSDEGVQPQGQGRLLPQDHLDQRAGWQEGRQADQPVAPDRLCGVRQVEEQGAGRATSSRSRASRFPTCDTRCRPTTRRSTTASRRCPKSIEKGWALVAATPMLKYASFMPNHPKIGQYNAIVFKGIQGVETGRLTAQAATDFVVDELSNELGKDVVIRELKRPVGCASRRGRRMPPLRSGQEIAMPDFARAQLRRQRANFALFLGPALILLLRVLRRAGHHRPGAGVHRHGPHAGGHASSRSRISSAWQRAIRACSAALGITAIFVVTTLGHLQRHVRPAAGVGHHRSAAAASARSFARCGCCRG